MKTIVLGPPGTGKTHTLLNQVEDYLKNTDPDRIGYFHLQRKQRTKQSLGLWINLITLKMTYHILEQCTR